ncbi:DUF3147 family protein [Psychrobacter sp. M13]|uniref:DUF3147 family protein n=1 Tax=Psychrobacter sp. M13 TaxID=3067275 RepID=UPI00273CF33C|nr:DUF3147 family protein [Psychrobacter sp. M13]WLP95912.1 DUF3147 family protein [Psychrobacter sp. M13]
MSIWFKYAITASLVVIISEVAKRSDRVGALLASLPLVTLLTLIWLYVEKQPIAKISNHAYYTFWYVLGTLPFFLLFPYLLNKFGFGMALLSSSLLTALFFALFATVLQSFKINLF